MVKLKFHKIWDGHGEDDTGKRIYANIHFPEFIGRLYYIGGIYLSVYTIKEIKYFVSLPKKIKQKNKLDQPMKLSLPYQTSF